jgi:peptide/nickel transport system ATP-binding protein
MVLEVRDLSIEAPGGFTVALPELRLARGEVAALYGPSGCGKSSVLAALFGLLLRPGWWVRGEVQCAGQPFAALTARQQQEWRRQQLAFLPQDAQSALDPLQRVGRQIRQATGKPLASVVAMLTRLGIADAKALACRLPHAISGGQAQRVLLAIGFLRQPALVVADEPSASLDGGSYAELVQHLRAFLAAGSAVLLATHDHRLLRDLSARVFRQQGNAFVPAALDELPWPRRPVVDAGAVPVLQARGLRVAFGNRTVLDGVDLALQRGEVVGLVGESGAGKTTLVRVLAGHLRAGQGVVQRPARAAAVQLVCQDALASMTPGRTLESLLAEAKAPYFDAVVGANSVRLPPAILARSAEAMSGGERRRAAMLRALAVQPDVLMLDEPTASLDRPTAVAVVETLLQLQRDRGLTLLLVTHDEDLARAVADRVLRVEGGRLCSA